MTTMSNLSFSMFKRLPSPHTVYLSYLNARPNANEKAIETSVRKNLVGEAEAHQLLLATFEMPLEVGLTRHRGAEAGPEGEKCGDATAPAKERCPRCDSRDTKFCYYNNYNTSQPRHFCKSCRRYWTLGGSLRNVPIGGASRKRLRRSMPTSESPARVVPRLSLPASCPMVVELGNPETPAPPPGHDPVRGGPVQNGLLGLGEALRSDRATYGLGLGLDLGYGSGPLPVTEEMGFGLAPTLLWPMDNGETWRVGAGGGGCFAARPLVAGPAVPPLSAMVEGGAGPAGVGELQWWSCE